MFWFRLPISGKFEFTLFQFSFMCSTVKRQVKNRTVDFAISNSKGVDMGDKGKKDKARREDQKKSKLTPKEKRKRKKEKKEKGEKEITTR